MSTGRQKNIVGFIQEDKGGLPYMLAWQSLDGRLCYEYHEEFKQVQYRERHLLALGLKARIWIDFNSIKI